MKDRIIRWYTYGHWHISLCALLLYLAGSTFSEIGFHPATGLHVFCATQFIYTLHRLVSSDKMIGQQEGRYSFIKAQSIYSYSILIFSGTLSLISFFFLPTTTQYLLIASGFISLGYILPLIFHKRLRDIGISKIILISLVWGTVSILSFHINDSLSITIPFFLEQFFFIFALTIPFDVRDQELDQKAKVSNLVNTIGLQRIKILMAFLICAAMACSFFLMYKGTYSIALFVALLVFYIFQYLITKSLSKKHNEMHYLFYLDGLILVKSIVYLTAVYI